MWGRRLHFAIRAFHELLMYIQLLASSPNDSQRAFASGMTSRIFYHEEFLTVFPKTIIGYACLFRYACMRARARVCLCVFVCVCVCFGPFAMPEHMLLVSTANEPTPLPPPPLHHFHLFIPLSSPPARISNLALSATTDFEAHAVHD